MRDPGTKTDAGKVGPWAAAGKSLEGDRAGSSTAGMGTCRCIHCDQLPAAQHVTAHYNQPHFTCLK